MGIQQLSPGQKHLIIILGPTAVGKTSLAINLAQHFKTEIISADSRQFYREMTIGTAKPSPEELALVRHHLVGMLSISDYYNVFRFETEVMSLLENLFTMHHVVIMAGGSGLYIDTICHGIDHIPDPDEDLRNELNQIFLQQGIQPLRDRLKLLDYQAYQKIDLANPKRIIRALEVCLTTGRAYSSFLNNVNPDRPFNIIKIGLKRERKELYDRINRRVDNMVANGLAEEARTLYPYRDYNSLQTVGYRELFEHFDGSYPLETAIEKIKTNTRRYAKKQMTWFARDKDIHWFSPDEAESIKTFLTKQTNTLY